LLYASWLSIILTPAADDPVWGHDEASKNLYLFDMDVTFDIRTYYIADLPCQMT